jgi:hypothetical protein
MPFDTKQGPEPQDEERVDVQALEVARKQQACTSTPTKPVATAS